MRSSLDMYTPIEEGVIKDWDQMNKIWEYCFSEELRIETSDFKILMSEAPMTSNYTRERLTQHIFEGFNAKGFYLAPQAVLTLYSSGRTTGLVVDSGEGSTEAVPVYEGFVVKNAVNRNYIAGKAITDYFVTLMSQEE